MRIALATPDEWESPAEALPSFERTTFTSWHAVGGEEVRAPRARRCRPAIRSLYSAWFPRAGDHAVFYAGPDTCECRPEQAESEASVHPAPGEHADTAQQVLSRGADNLTRWIPRTHALIEAEWKEHGLQDRDPRRLAAATHGPAGTPPLSPVTGLLGHLDRSGRARTTEP